MNAGMKVMLYRGMRPAAGVPLRPQCGDTGATLGVRANKDLPVINGRVMPGTGGVSVVCEHWQALPAHRTPVSHGGESDDHVIFSIAEQGLSASLQVRQDKPLSFPAHRVIEPAREMSFAEFRADVHATQPIWEAFDP